jgi:thioredoxin-related protein
MEKEPSHLARFRKIDVANDPEVAEFYGVNSIPAIIIKAANGRIIVKHEGYLDKESILNALRVAAKN